MAKRKRRSKKGLFKKMLAAGSILALAPFIPAMVGLIAATVTTNPVLAKKLKKKLKKKKLKSIVKEFMEKVIKKKHLEGTLESSFDFEYAFEGETFHMDGDHIQALDVLYENSLDELESGDLEKDNFVQAIADIIKMIFGFFKGLKKKKESGESVTAEEKEAIKESDVSEKEADEKVAHAQDKQKAGIIDPAMLKYIVIAVGGFIVVKTLMGKK